MISFTLYPIGRRQRSASSAIGMPVRNRHLPLRVIVSRAMTSIFQQLGGHLVPTLYIASSFPYFKFLDVFRIIHSHQKNTTHQHFTLDQNTSNGDNPAQSITKHPPPTLHQQILLSDYGQRGRAQPADEGRLRRGDGREGHVDGGRLLRHVVRTV